MKDRALSPLQEYVLPILCGNNAKTRRLSAKLFRRYGIVSLIYGKRSWRDLFSLSSQTLCLPYPDSPRLIAETLCDLSHRYNDMLLVLIPCDDLSVQAVSAYTDRLEHRFILSDENNLFVRSPLREIADSLRTTR